MTTAENHIVTKELPTSFYIVAGEASGDRHGALLASELLAARKGSKCYGVGGPFLHAAGQDQLFDLAKHAVVGLTDVIVNYRKFSRFFQQIMKDIEDKNPSALILIDYPGFNLRLAKAVRSAMPKLPIIYYISPQVWAWKQHRARAMAKTLDLLLVIFKFEETWFAEHEPRLKVKWTGHPLLDRWQGPAERDPEDSHIRQITLMPGSRPKEIERHLPVLLETSRRLWHQNKQLRFNILAVDNKAEKLIMDLIVELHFETLHAEVLNSYQLTHLCRSDLAIVASGSATVECCLAGVPMLVIYKVNPITYAVGKAVTQVPYLAMVNILAGKKIVPEFLQEKASPEYLYQAIRRIQQESRWSETMKSALKDVSAQLGTPGASKRAAAAILELVDHRA